MGFPGVVPEHVPGTLGEHGMFPVPCSLFPVPLRIPPPQKKFMRLTPQNLTSGGPAGRLVTCSLFPVPCSHKTPLREHVFRVPCSLSPYGKTHPWKNQTKHNNKNGQTSRAVCRGRDYSTEFVLSATTAAQSDLIERFSIILRLPLFVILYI